jgi:hypothetical protein
MWTPASSCGRERLIAGIGVRRAASLLARNGKLFARVPGLVLGSL